MPTIWIIVLSLVGLTIGIPILVLLFLTVCSLFVRNKSYAEHSKFYRGLLNFSVGFFRRIVRIKFVVHGAEKLDGIGRFVIVTNHTSNLDPIAVFGGLMKHDVAFLSKPENFNIVIFGKIIRKCCFLPIDRENARNALMTIKDSARLIKNDQVSIGVCPEGTRSKTGELLPFHDGVFMIASLSNSPVVVAVVRNAEEFKKHPVIKRTTVTLDILSVIPAEVVKAQSTHQTSDMVREQMLQALAKKD